MRDHSVFCRSNSGSSSDPNYTGVTRIVWPQLLLALMVVSLTQARTFAPPRHTSSLQHSYNGCGSARGWLSNFPSLQLGLDRRNCMLAGIAPAVSSHTVNFFMRSDDGRRLDLGKVWASEICMLFTGSTTAPCAPFLTTTAKPLSLFQGPKPHQRA